MKQRLIINKNEKEIIIKKSFKELLECNKITKLCGVHNALIALLAQEAGFDGLWLSSFEVHASCRLPDADILSIPDYSDIVNKISDRVSIPMIVDGDCGGGSPINTIRMVREYEKNGALGICLEDNLYPKRCSFYDTEERKLEIPKKHAAKINAACNNRLDDSFLVIARIESLIIGEDVNKAIERANIYIDAGADAILIHHKGEDPSQIFEFSSLFKKNTPLVCVPTTYNIVTEKELIDNGFKMVIYANCSIRAIVKILQEVFKTIVDKKTFSSVNDKISSLSEIFRLVGVSDFYNNEKKYQ
jgi:phosphoenolpyruvate phosphomutase